MTPRRIENRTRTRAGIGGDQERADQVSQWPLVCRPALLNLSRPPARPQELGEFGARQPSLARVSLRRQGDSDKGAMKPFLCMMIDCGLKVLKIAPGAAIRSSPLGISPTGRAVDVAQMLIAEEIERAAVCVHRTSLAAPVAAQRPLDRRSKHRQSRISEMSRSRRAGWYLLAMYSASALFSLSTFGRAAAGGDLPAAVFNHPCRALDSFVAAVARWPKPKVGALRLSRHFRSLPGGATRFGGGNGGEGFYAIRSEVSNLRLSV